MDRGKIIRQADELEGYLECVSSDALLSVARGQIDAEKVRRKVLASRSLDGLGGWCSFEDARKLWLGEPTRIERLVDICQKVFVLWEKHGLGDDDTESESVYNELLQILAEVRGVVKPATGADVADSGSKNEPEQEDLIL